MDPPSKGKPPHLFKHYKDIKTLTNNSDTSLSGYRQRIFLRSAFYRYKEHIPPTSSIRLTHHPSKGYGDYNVYGPFTNHPREGHTSVQTTPTGGGIPTTIGPWVNHYRFEVPLIGDCFGRVQSSIESAKASHAQLPDIPLQSDAQALRLIASIPLIQRREKCPSREEKSAFM